MKASTLNSKQLEEYFQINKHVFYHYINNIKKKMPLDIYAITNTTLICNPYSTEFPKKFFLKKLVKKNNKIVAFIKNSIRFYFHNFYLLISYLLAFTIFKIFYKRDYKNYEEGLFIDVFFLVDNINKSNKFVENYFSKLYPVLESKNINYIFLPRLYGISRNPLKLIKFFKIINKSDQTFLFEFQLLKAKNFLQLFFIIIKYPFKTLRLLQKENTQNNTLFNNELLKDIQNVSLDAFTRYIFGQNIANLPYIKKIYSWSEFQVIERSFNYAIRTKTDNIRLYGCQFYTNYETYFNMFVHDLDYEQKTSPHEILVNGSYYLLKQKKICYKTGVSLRYGNVFNNNIHLRGNRSNTLVLGSYIETDTKFLLECANEFDKILFKNHPSVDINKISSVITTKIQLVEDDIYELFKNAKIVLCTAFSSTAVEAITSGVPVIIIASQDNLTANPLVAYGKGEIWDIAFSKDDVAALYNNLLRFRKENILRIQEIATWYKDNFFIEPTEANIIKAFELDRE